MLKITMSGTEAEVREPAPVAAPRIPMGRSEPPVPPIPKVRPPVSTATTKKKQTAVSHGHRINKAPPPWVAAYLGFEMRVGSYFLPLLVMLSAGALAIHIAALTGSSKGYFSWDIKCEGLVLGGTTSGSVLTRRYELGWAKFVITDGGVAGAATPLGKVDAATALFGAVTGIVHLVAAMCHAALLYAAAWLFRHDFRAPAWRAFKIAHRGVVAVLVANVVLVMVVFGVTAKYAFTDAVMSSLKSSSYFCAANDDVGGEYAYTCAGFACAATALLGALLQWRGARADAAVAWRFNRRKTLAPLAAAPRPSQLQQQQQQQHEHVKQLQDESEPPTPLLSAATGGGLLAGIPECDTPRSGRGGGGFGSDSDGGSHHGGSRSGGSHGGSGGGGGGYASSNAGYNSDANSDGGGGGIAGDGAGFNSEPGSDNGGGDGGGHEEGAAARVSTKVRGGGGAAATTAARLFRHAVTPSQQLDEEGQGSGLV
eukprot:TRINITY_DN4355_c0_g1_i8.p1 TRINITY_DN4355_c0_g1~~TRINITY_DN4355_c0_g1_i8.p1  ORF type:complete len:482 (-),score=179.93 TRINITY_DN4355_c0_g1_i8:337-1782(-)